MYFLESLKSALQNVRANKLRSFLTMLGIIIGISSVITIVSLGQGGKNYITGQFENIGTNIVNIKVQAKENDIVRSTDYLTMEDVQLIKEKIDNVDAVIPALGAMGSLKTDTKSKQVQVAATTDNYCKIYSLEVLSGRFMNQHDIDTEKNIVIIDDTAALKLFNTTNAVGKRVTLNTQSDSIGLTVQGVIKNPAGNLASSFRDNMPGYAFIPIGLSSKLMPNTKMNQLSVTLKDMNISSETSSKITRFLNMKHNTKDKYVVEEGFKQLDTINNVLNMLTAVIGAIAGISLLVGGIGVMNIMLVSVTERTREIGIRKALGATMTDIRLQFLTESLILCLVGGCIGMLLGILVGIGIGKIIKLGAVLTPGVVLISFLFSSAVGIFFGLYPANKAAKLDPIEALRYE